VSGIWLINFFLIEVYNPAALRYGMLIYCSGYEPPMFDRDQAQGTAGTLVAALDPELESELLADDCSYRDADEANRIFGRLYQ
jgi:hypothetical protein